jgi:hypothetical protein
MNRRRIHPGLVLGVLTCLGLTAPGARADDEGEGYFETFFDPVSDAEAGDRFGVLGLFTSSADYFTFLGGFRGRVTRRLHILGGFSNMPLEDSDEPQYLGFHLAAQGDLVSTGSGRVYYGVSHAIYSPSIAGDWEGETVHALGFGFGVAQRMPLTFFIRMRMLFEATWIVTGEGTWTVPGTGPVPIREQTDDFKGSHMIFGAEFLL